MILTKTKVTFEILPHLSMFHIMRLIGLTASLLIIATFLLRINLPRKYSNKYVCWTLFFLSANYFGLTDPVAIAA